MKKERHMDCTSTSLRIFDCSKLVRDSSNQDAPDREANRTNVELDDREAKARTSVRNRAKREGILSMSARGWVQALGHIR